MLGSKIILLVGSLFVITIISHFSIKNYILAKEGGTIIIKKWGCSDSVFIPPKVLLDKVDKDFKAWTGTNESWIEDQKAAAEMKVYRCLCDNYKEDRNPNLENEIINKIKNDRVLRQRYFHLYPEESKIITSKVCLAKNDIFIRPNYH